MSLPLGAVTALADMLKMPEEEDDSDSDIDDKPIGSTAKMGPGSIGPAAKKTNKNAEQKSKKNSKDIWNDEEVQEGAEFEVLDDPRPQPEYDIIYKQAVTSEDMFLQMGNKNPATASCEDMIVKINLPGCKVADVTLDVKSKFLDCRTPTYRLGLHLPHPVDHKSGKAQWDGNKEVLSVTLRMTREYDFMNL